LLALGLCTGPAAAATGFASASLDNPAMLLPPPPPDGSPEAKVEMDELHRLEKARSAAEYAHAKQDGETENVTAFADVMGPGFELKQLPKTAALFADLRNEEKHAATLAKNHFRRNRPWIIDPSLKTCERGDKPQSSYPSGHATMGYSFAVVLAALAPEKAQAILARASDYAESRLVCAMHYRRDIVAGQALGTAVAVEVMTLPAFKAEFDAARDELRAAHVVN
jgi:acid phosphatase (class A)